MRFHGGFRALYEEWTFDSRVLKLCFILSFILCFFYAMHCILALFTRGRSSLEGVLEIHHHGPLVHRLDKSLELRMARALVVVKSHVLRRTNVDCTATV